MPEKGQLVHLRIGKELKRKSKFQGVFLKFINFT